MNDKKAFNDNLTVHYSYNGVDYQYQTKSPEDAYNDVQWLNSLQHRNGEPFKHSYEVGQDVSRNFNGDSYYSGKITRITKNFIFTSKGYKFSKRTLKSEAHVYNTNTQKFEYYDKYKEFFKEVNSPFWMISGFHNELNPHF